MSKHQFKCFSRTLGNGKVVRGASEFRGKLLRLLAKASEQGSVSHYAEARVPVFALAFGKRRVAMQGKHFRQLVSL